MTKQDVKLTIVTVAFNDVWSLSKTVRSVAMQQSSFPIEYVVVDGGSSDATLDLVSFWTDLGVINRVVSEADGGVYDAMNRGVGMANGDYVLFMNAGDVFYSDYDVQYALDVLSNTQVDGLLGWGSLKDQIWASWFVKTDAIRMASLGFCHQALFLKRTWLESYPFLTEPGQTDSDTRQLADCIAAGAKIKIEKRVLAIRSPSDGISADLDLTRASIAQTIKNGYPSLADSDVQSLITFRRDCSDFESALDILKKTQGKARHDIALMILDTIYLRQAKSLDKENVERLLCRALDAVWQFGGNPETHGELLDMLTKKFSILSDMKLARRRADTKNLETRVGLMNQGFLSDSASQTSEVNVSLTTFPARAESLRLVLDSLLCQSVKPKKVSLVVGRDEFRNQWQFPKDVYELIGDNFEIIFVEKTAHQYDKFIHTWRANENHPVVIVDDDVVYPPQAIENLLLTSRKYSGCVVANRSHRLTMNSMGELLPYSDWEREVQNSSPSHDLFPTGAGGVLYPKGFFGQCVDQQQILANCPYADDIWLKVMSIYHGIKVKSSASDCASWKLGYTADMQDFALHKGNVDFGLNDLQLKRSFAWLEKKSVDWRARLRE